MKCSCISFLVLLQQITTNLVTLNNTNYFLYSSGGQKPEMGIMGIKSRCRQSCVPSGGSRDNLFPCPFQLVDTSHIPWLLVPSSIFKASNVAPLWDFLPPSHLPPTDSSPLPPSTFKKPWGNMDNLSKSPYLKVS